MKVKFSWDSFDRDFIESILFSTKTKNEMKPNFRTEDKELYIPYMDKLALTPTQYFVKTYKEEIIEHFLKNSNHLVSITKVLEKRNYKNIQVDTMDNMLENLKNCRLTQTVISAIIAELYFSGKQWIMEDVSIYNCPRTIDLDESQADATFLYDYQKDAVNALKKYFIDEDKSSGILVMPTGSGKTRVATDFLLSNLVADGYQIVWLTHRAMLIEQTADTVYFLAPLAKANGKKKFKMICLSGEHSSSKALEKSDDFIIASVRTLCMNLDYLVPALGEKVMIVVDEAHHTIAPSYMSIINKIRSINSSAKLLGLTATPVRMSDNATHKLMNTFDNSIVYNVSTAELCAKGVLAKPNYIPIDTNIDFKTTLNTDDEKYIKKWGEISPDFLEKMSKIKERNELIVSTYLNNKEKFGKTLVFALNGTHCIALSEEFKKHDVKCDYIYCAHSGNEEKIRRFKENELDVLININVMTEGSDIPDIQTVFLTRPTSSDTLLMQMIGRGMRGKHCGGTEEVNIVSFNDIWGDFSKWLSPTFITAYEEVEEETSESVEKEKEEKEIIPLEYITDSMNLIDTQIGEFSESKAVIPIGWYDVIDEDGNDTKMLVYESYIRGVLKMKKDVDRIISKNEITGEIAQIRYFNYFGLTPSIVDLENLIRTIRLLSKFPERFTFSKGQEIDASKLADKFKKNDYRISQVNAEISNVFKNNKSLIESIYGDICNYKSRINDYMLSANGIRPNGCKIEEMPVEFLPFDKTPVYDLVELQKEVVGEMFEGEFKDLPPIYWTDKAYKQYFGVFSYIQNGSTVSNEHILINCILNSKDIPKEVIKYLIYHEMLHKEFHNHSKEFRAKEHLYPNYTEYEHFLFHTFPMLETELAM